MKPWERSPQRRRYLGAAVAAFGLVASLLAASPAVATPDPGDAPHSERMTKDQASDTRAAIENGEIPGVDEIVHSDNVSHLTNIPKQDLKGTNSDLAFQGKYAFAGNYDGFVIYDISRPKRPEVVSQVLCPGAQNDVSVSGNLLFLSTDSSRSDNSCNSTTQPATEKSSWEGMKVFDISDKRNPRYVAAVETSCGSHTHTLAPDRKNVYVYVSSYYPSETFPDCQPPHDGISVIKVPRKAPEKAAVVDFPVLFPDGGNPGGPDNPGVSQTTGCHDLTTFPELKLAAGACMGDGILLDIADPAKPRVIDRVEDNVNFAFWHSATFNERGNKVVFTDELGGGGSATCNEETGPTRGADGIYDIVGKGDKRKLKFRSYYKIPRHQAAHRELRRPQRFADPRQGPRHHGPGVVPGRRVHLGLHRLQPPQGDRLLRTRSDLGRQAGLRRLLVRVLLQRPHLLERHHQGLRRPEDRRPAHGQRPVGAAARAERPDAAGLPLTARLSAQAV
ncbi:putative secreted protein [Streptomyces himastatinicus ATCC 53653]|uniref:Putative secreted protein n=1 Tax=Streptomyces himastatinicus ATCC 53653 TaxID=457427 RepID=D9WLJ4_9ACTN|nr:putative secreted protein [Streptomyces himastatinicus ATCC 53653]